MTEEQERQIRAALETASPEIKAVIRAIGEMAAAPLMNKPHYAEKVGFTYAAALAAIDLRLQAIERRLSQ